MSACNLYPNSVILKSSEHTPLTVKLLKEIWDNATDEPDIFQVVYGAGEKYVTYRANEHGAPPVNTSVTLSFQELEFVDRQMATFGTHDSAGRNKKASEPTDFRETSKVPPHLR